MRELFLIRHGESEHHVRGLSGGWTDLPLTASGRRQASAMARRLREMIGDSKPALYSSDLLRASETAAAIARELSTPVTLRAELRELNNGVARGLSEVEARPLRRSPTSPVLDWVPFEGGESWRDLQSRVGVFLG